MKSGHQQHRAVISGQRAQISAVAIHSRGVLAMNGRRHHRRRRYKPRLWSPRFFVMPQNASSQTLISGIPVCTLAGARGDISAEREENDDAFARARRRSDNDRQTRWPNRYGRNR